MDLSIIIISLLCLLSLLLLLLSSTRTNKHINLPPGPTNLPVIGNLYQFTSAPHRALHKLSQKHGPIMFLRLGTVPAIIASSASTAKEFLKTHDLSCCSRPLLTPLKTLTYNFCDVVFSPYDEQWRELRKTCILHLFNSKKVASFRAIREEEVDRMIGCISSSCSENTAEIDISEMLLELAYDITCRAALGKRYDTGGSGLSRILNETQALFTAFFFADYIPMLGFLDTLTGTGERLEKNFRELDEFYQKVIDEHLDMRKRNEDEDGDFVHVLLEMKERDGNLTDDHIKGVLMNIFVAGSDTSSATVEWAMTELMREPRAMKKLQDEVRSLVGNKAKVDETDLDQLRFLKSVVKETMRLHPPVPLLVQRETRQHININGYDVPAKSRLLINAFAIARDTDSWDRPDEFYPERFMDCSIDFLGHDFEFIPFGAGRRICPGMHSGVMVVELALANLVYLFDWGLLRGTSKEDIDMGESMGVTVHRKVGLQLVATKYQGAKG